MYLQIQIYINKCIGMYMQIYEHIYIDTFLSLPLLGGDADGEGWGPADFEYPEPFVFFTIISFFLVL
jgi:hypothetical protein